MNNLAKYFVAAFALAIVGAGAYTFFGASEGPNVPHDITNVLAWYRATDQPSTNITAIPLKSSGTVSDTSWKQTDTTKPFALARMIPFDTTIAYAFSVLKDAKDGAGLWTTNQYHVAIFLQVGNSKLNTWRPELALDSAGQYGTKQQYHAKQGGTCDSGLIGRPLGFILKLAYYGGADQARFLIKKDTALTAHVWNIAYQIAVIARTQGGG